MRGRITDKHEAKLYRKATRDTPGLTLAEYVDSWRETRIAFENVKPVTCKSYRQARLLAALGFEQPPHDHYFPLTAVGPTSRATGDNERVGHSRGADTTSICGHAFPENVRVDEGVARKSLGK